MMTDDLIQRLEQGVADTGTAINTAASINATMAEAKHEILRFREERNTFYMDYRIKCDRDTKRLEEELAAIKAQEPVAWMSKDEWGYQTIQCVKGPLDNAVPLYTAPQPAPAVEAALKLAQEALYMSDPHPMAGETYNKALAAIDAAMKNK
jgi:hypothetical protein